MTDTSVRPADYTDVLDWNFDIAGVDKPLGCCNAVDLRHIAGHYSKRGVLPLASSLIALANELDDQQLVEELNPNAVEDILWAGTAEHLDHESSGI